MLTRKDVEIYRIQWSYEQKHGYAPTIREIARLYNTPSWSHIPDSLERLMAARLLSKTDLKRAGIYKPQVDPDEVDWESLVDGKDPKAS